MNWRTLNIIYVLEGFSLENLFNLLNLKSVKMINNVKRIILIYLILWFNSFTRLNNLNKTTQKAHFLFIIGCLLNNVASAIEYIHLQCYGQHEDHYGMTLVVIFFSCIFIPFWYVKYQLYFFVINDWIQFQWDWKICENLCWLLMMAHNMVTVGEKQ